MSEQEQNTEEKDQKQKPGGGKKFPLPKNAKYLIMNAYGDIAQYKTINDVPISKKFGNSENIIG